MLMCHGCLRTKSAQGNALLKQAPVRHSKNSYSPCSDGLAGQSGWTPINTNAIFKAAKNTYAIK